MPGNSHRHGLVVIPAHANLSRDSQATVDDIVTINALKISADSTAKQLLPLYVLVKAGVPNMIVEISRFSHPFGSWFIVPEDVNLVPEICSNGNMTLITRVDPLFAALAVMDFSRKAAGKDVFQPLEVMCTTPDGINLARLCDPDQFTLICDIKEAAGDKYYRLNDQKVTHWLVKKHANLTNHPYITHERALQIISQYVTENWERLLLTALGSSLNTDPPAFTVPQRGQMGADLAMAIMMEDAKETNRANRLVQSTNTPKSLKAKRMKTNSSKKRPPPSEAVANFWSAVKSKRTPSR